MTGKNPWTLTFLENFFVYVLLSYSHLIHNVQWVEKKLKNSVKIRDLEIGMNLKIPNLNFLNYEQYEPNFEPPNLPKKNNSTPIITKQWQKLFYFSMVCCPQNIPQTS